MPPTLADRLRHILTSIEDIRLMLSDRTLAESILRCLHVRGEMMNRSISRFEKPARYSEYIMQIAKGNHTRHHSRQRGATRSSTPACFCRQPITLNRFFAWGLPRGPNIRIKLFAGAPVAAPSLSNPIVASM